MKSLAAEIRRLCPHPDYATGIASLEGLLAGGLSDYRYGLSLVRRLDDAVIDRIVDGPTVEYLELYHSVNRELNAKASEIAELLKSAGIDALPVKATLDEHDLDREFNRTLRCRVSHKMVATRAGLGWIGKTDLLVSRRFGPRVRLASVLMMEAIDEPGVPITGSRCGACRICIEACPAGAATGGLWTAGVDRDTFYNAFKCMEFCRRISKERIGGKATVCGICVARCPVGAGRV